MLYVMNKSSLITIVIVGIIGFAPVPYATAQDLGALTLEECIAIAQDQSPIAEAARYDLIASNWQYRSFRADLLPSLTLSGDAPNFSRSLQQQFSDGVFQYFDITQSDASARLGINQNILYTGGSLSLSTGLTRLGIFKGEDRYLWQSTPLVVGYTQPIFQFNNLKWRNRLEPLQHEIAQKEFVEEMEGVAVSVTQRFFDVYLARINLENAQFNVARNDSIYNISQGRYNVGSIAENDLLQTELALRNAESSLTRARIEYDRVLNEFKIYMGYPTEVELELDEPEELPEMDVDIQQAKQLAIQNNSEALNYRLSELQAERSLAQAKSQGGFSATLRANYGLNQTSEDFNDVYSSPLDQQFFTVGFDIPIFNWGKQRAEVNAARNQQQAVSNSIEFQRRQFNQQVEYIVSQFLQLRDQVLLAAQADTIAQRRYEVAQNRYLIGKIDITNLFIAQNEKDQARQGYIRALREFWSGWYELRQLTLYDFYRDEPISYGLD